MKIKINKVLWTITLLVLVFATVNTDCFAETYSDGRVLKGYDGCSYSLSGYYNGYCYNSVGWLMSTLKHEELGETQLYHYVNDGGDKTIAYCLEHRVSADGTYDYSSTSIGASKYMGFYPKDQREGILKTAMYAPQHIGEKSPVEGTNTDDWYWAAQVVIWEFQEGIRRDVNDGIWDRHTGRFIDKNGTVRTGSSNRHYYNSLFYEDGRSKPAYKCYKWIITNLNSKDNIPSFASGSLSSAKTYNMKFDTDGTYFVELEDSGDLKVDFFTDALGITIKREGNKYTFRSDEPLVDGKIISGIKVPEKAGEAVIVWDAIGTHRQTLMTGTPDPKSMYIKLKGELPRGNLLIHKTAEDGEVKDIKFKISGPEELYVTTDESGYALAEDLLCGTYTVSECDVAMRYVKPDDVNVVVEYEKTEEVNFTNVLKTIDLVIEKRDAYTGEPLENTVFVVIDEGVKARGSYEEYVTDENGRVFINGILKAGHEYKVKEIKPPEGYKLDEIDGLEVKPTGEAAEEDVTFRNKPYLGFKLIKTTESGNPLEGAEYAFYKEGALLFKKVTDEFGEINIMDLEPGDYQVKETKAPKGRIIDDFAAPFTIRGEDKNTYVLKLQNRELTGSLRIIKLDQETKMPISKTVFTVYAAEAIINADGLKYEKDQEVLTVTGDGDGNAVTEELSLGRYYVVEKKASSGYIKTDERYDFEISDEKGACITIENKRTINPKTGDDSNLMLMIVLGFLCLSGAIIGIKLIDYV